MDMKIDVRPQRLSDAKRFFEILSNPNFTYFSAKPKSVEEQKSYLRLNKDKLRNKSGFHFSIMYNEKIIGAIGIKIDLHRAYIGEIGYFIDEKYWRRGIATEAVQKMEEFIYANLKLHRIEIRMAKANKASQKVAIKCGYKKEGLLKQMLLVEGKWFDCYLYAKIIS